VQNAVRLRDGTIPWRGRRALVGALVPPGAVGRVSKDRTAGDSRTANPVPAAPEELTRSLRRISNQLSGVRGHAQVQVDMYALHCDGFVLPSFCNRSSIVARTGPPAPARATLADSAPAQCQRERRLCRPEIFGQGGVYRRDGFAER